MSQAVFADVLNTSVSTAKKWEIGEKHPSGPSLKLLDVVDPYRGACVTREGGPY